ncbi:thioredoxin [Dactylococcopsis salina]|uniref:Thioredoxin n=1 Tax=Dactylococcopsis salina (strain PCC 8305) TaxID=13035 RepID=K9YWG6_DACS8|nr:thioredoxin [Dactylococcopsis salina]AFZ50857.1 thioredoxin [Dactylococcopsis salina PCC 8305]
MATKKQYNSFSDLLAESTNPVLVDFYAVWCGPCQMMSPVLDTVKKQFQNRLTVVKIDTDKYPEIASEHHILALPTLILFKEGKPAKRFEGMSSSEQLISQLETLI